MSKMKEIFVIISGEYPDCRIEGFVDTEDEAMRACVSHNESYEHEYEDWYYEKISHLGEIPQFELLYVEEVFFDKLGTSWRMRNEPNRYKCKEYKGVIPDPQVEPAGLCTRQPKIIGVKVYLRERNRKKAEKIAQNALYEFLYKAR